MPRKFEYQPLLKPFAQEMRRNPTSEEQKLWYCCLSKLPVRFRRQKQFGRFIVDFYCSSLNLIIEIDGNQHYGEQGLAYDAERTGYLEGLGMRVLRFTNDQVRNDFNQVCGLINTFVFPVPLSDDSGG